MAGPPTFATPPGFLGIERREAGATYVVAGVPMDIGTTNRAGTRDGPAAIRRASRMLVDGVHPAHWVDPRDLDIADIGEFAIALGDIPGSLALIERQAASCRHLVALGGEHGITLPLLRALSKRLGGPVGLLHCDAHVDTWADNFGQAYAHGSPFYHAIREGLVDPSRMIQVGIRSPVDRATWDWTIGHGVTIVTGQEAQELGPAALAEQVRAVLGAGPSYLSFDIDCLDPAFAPGTGTPEIGGLASWQAQGLIRRLRGIDFRGMDVVEVSPAYDDGEITALAAATLAWEYLALQALDRQDS
ncbi:agmatinase [Belnapia moabensis]|uniref:agmatinase n=1 Tax=Belnapia moabensis TaxID=365533 RepID=UPI0005BE622E|nr:agmatinase [Belnapia moabensis]